MIPILESGAPFSLNTDKNPVSAAATADAGSGVTFGQVLNAQEPASPVQPAEQGLAATNADNGNVLHPGGKDLPLDAALLGEAATSVVLDQQLLVQPQLSPAAPQVAAPLLTPGSDVIESETLLPLMPAASAEVIVSAALAAPASPVTAGPQVAVQAAIPAGMAESVGIRQRPSASPPGATTVLSSSLVTAEATDTTTARLQGILPAATGSVTEIDTAVARIPLPLNSPAALDEAPQRVLAPVTENIAPGVRAELPVVTTADQPLDKMVAELALAKSALEAANAAAGAEVSKPANAAAVQTSPAPLTAAMSPSTATMNTGLTPSATINSGSMLVSVTGEPAWNQEVAQRISMMFRGGVPEAKLQLNPPELGRMDVKITTEGDQARVLFSVQGAETRDVIEQALPRLRELLEESGLSLSQFDVADQPDPRQDSSGNSETASVTAESDDNLLRDEAAPLQRLTESNSLVDYYV